MRNAQNRSDRVQLIVNKPKRRQEPFKRAPRHTKKAQESPNRAPTEQLKVPRTKKTQGSRREPQDLAKTTSAPCAPVGGNELTPESRRYVFSWFYTVGPASDSATHKSMTPHRRRKADLCSPKFRARQPAVSVPTLKPPMCHALSSEEAKYLRNESVAVRGCQTVGQEVAVQPMRP